MSRLLDILNGSDAARSQPEQLGFIRINRLFRTLQLSFEALEIRCPEQVEIRRWQQTVDDGWRFLSSWGEQAAALGWSDHDLFALHPFAPDARYDTMGLVWLLRGRPVVALTASTAAIRTVCGSTLTYRCVLAQTTKQTKETR
jgi:hypothetical protein